jgi:hypothetical protein
LSFEIYRCKECGWCCSAEPKGAVGTAHAHAERHACWWVFPAWLFPVADPVELDKFVEKLEVVEA